MISITSPRIMTTMAPPFRWDPERRVVLRAELDAAFFHLYGISRHDTDYILATFPALRDALAAATASGKPYVSPLSPPPGDRRAAHQEK